MSQLKPAIAKQVVEPFIDRCELRFTPPNVNKPTLAGTNVTVGVVSWVLGANGDNLDSQITLHLPINLADPPPTDPYGVVSFAPGATLGHLIKYLGDAIMVPAIVRAEIVPVNLVADDITDTGCTLSWAVGVPAWTQGYKVYQSSDGGQTWTILADVGNVLSYTVAGLAAGTQYLFAVAAYGAHGESGKATISVTTAPAEATG